MNSESIIFEELKALILDIKNIQENEVNLDSSFSQLKLDSLDFVELEVAARKDYNVILVPELFRSGEISTLRQLIHYILVFSDVALG